MNTEQLKYFMSGIVFASFIMAVVSFIVDVWWNKKLEK